MLIRWRLMPPHVRHHSKPGLEPGFAFFNAVQQHRQAADVA
jgi:hypothetical protein